MNRIVIDAFGGDYAPDEIVKGAVMGAQKVLNVHITLTGDQAKIEELLKGQTYDKSRISIHHASEVIHTEESPVKALRAKKDSSLVRALELVANQEADVLISSGSTGAVLSGATLIVKRIKGVLRPALAPFLPTVKGGQVLLIDCGANVDSKPRYLQQFAVMGSAYCTHVMGVQKPRVGLINNGAEASKGNALTKEAYPLLEQAPIHFVGNCEPRDVLSGEFDVVVADGFDGNIVLKSTEGAMQALMQIMKRELMSSTRTKIGAAIANPAFKRMKTAFSYDDKGGALLLGVNGGIIKTHGNAKAETIGSAVVQGCAFIEADMVRNIARSIESIEM